MGVENPRIFQKNHYITLNVQINQQLVAIQSAINSFEKVETDDYYI